MDIKTFDTTWMSLTYNCNNRCNWCYAASNSEENRLKSLNPESEQGIVNLFSDLHIKRVILIGGEPTLYRNIYGLLEKISETEMSVGMVTNGRRLKDRNFARGLKERGLDSLAVSIEGYDSETHDAVTQVTGSYNESVEGIKVALSEGIRVSTNTVISSENINDLEKIVDSIRMQGINDIGFNICGVCVSKEENNSYLVNPRRASEAFAEVYKKFKGNGIRFKLVTPTPICFFNEEVREELNTKRIISGGPCQLVHGKNFVTDYNGDIVPCTHMTGFPIFNIFKEGGVISRDRFIELYHDENGLAFNFRKRLSKYPSQKCNDCNESCSGGCPLIWVKFNPNKEIGVMANA